ncbi:MAG: FkbM family methyltransferase [Longimicrobiales bacterium]
MTAVRKMLDLAACALELGTNPASSWALLWAQTKNLRVRGHVAHHHPKRVYSIDTTFGRLFFRDNFGDITNLTNLLHREVYAGVRPLDDGVVLDVGANIGLAAAWIAHRHPGHTTHCFEPVPDAARMIPLNCSQATVNQVAVGESAGQIELRVDADGVIASSIATRWATRPVRFQTIRLDDYVLQHDIADVALLKIDAEGMELSILFGATGTLSRTDQVALETHGLDRHRAVIDFLLGEGMSITCEAFQDTTGLVFAARSPVLATQFDGNRYRD